MITVFESLLPIFILISLGFGCKHLNIIPQELWRSVETLAYWLFFPALLAETMIKADLQSIKITTLAAVMLLSFFCMSMGLLIARRPLRKAGISAPSFTTVFQTSTRWNGFIALPIIDKLYGDHGVTLIAMIMAVLVPTANITNVLVLAAYAADTRPPLRRVIWLAFRNPFIWATIIGLLINLLAIPVYDPFMTTLDLLGGAALACGLLMVGSGLQLRAATNPSFAAILATGLKLLIMPALVTLWSLTLGLTGMAFIAVIIAASVPTAMNGYVLARQMGGDAPLYAATTTIQTILSIITIPILVWLAQSWTGL